jgi:hypothetical protein
MQRIAMKYRTGIDDSASPPDKIFQSIADQQGTAIFVGESDLERSVHHPVAAHG